VQAGAVEVDHQIMHALRVEAGRATFGADFDDHAYVQEAGLTQRAVSFSKGCYLGQEVVCMAQNRGKVHRKLVKLVLPTLGHAAIGAEVKSDGAVVGTLTSLVVRDDGSALALAMIKTVAADPGKIVEIADSRAEIVAAAS
jgi:folate-binding protein YgfZ